MAKPKGWTMKSFRVAPMQYKLTPIYYIMMEIPKKPHPNAIGIGHSLLPGPSLSILGSAFCGNMKSLQGGTQ